MQKYEITELSTSWTQLDFIDPLPLSPYRLKKANLKKQNTLEGKSGVLPVLFGAQKLWVVNIY